MEGEDGSLRQECRNVGMVGLAREGERMSGLAKGQSDGVTSLRAGV